jgi:tetratricopeptide (TPR) repeat protein
MRRREQGSAAGNGRATGPDVYSPRRVEFWVVIGAVLGFVLLNHFDLVLEMRHAGSRFDNPEQTIWNEFPNPFSDKGLGDFSASGSAGWLLVLHLGGTLGAGFVILRLVGSWAAAVAGAALYGVHPVHLLLIAQGADFALVAAPIGIFGATILFFGRGWAPALGGAFLALGSLLDPMALAWPVFLLSLRWLAPGTGPPGRGLGWAVGGAVIGGLLGVGFGVRAWPRLPLESAFLPPGPTIESPVQDTLLSLGRGLSHLIDPYTFPGIDYGRGEVALEWTLADPGAVWLLAVAIAGGVLTILALMVGRQFSARRFLGLAAAATLGLLYLPLPGLIASLHTEEGLSAGQLLAASAMIGLVVAAVVQWVLTGFPGSAGLRKLAAAAVAVVLVLPVSSATFSMASRVKSEDRALRAAWAESDRSYRLRRRLVELDLREGRNKLDILNRLTALTETMPDDPRAWAALGRLNWVVRRFPAAAVAFEQALRRAPENRAYRYYLAAAQLMSRRWDAALATARPLPSEVPEVQALRLLARARKGELPDPTIEASAHPILLRAYGMVLTESGEYAAALAVLERAQEQRPRDALIAAYRGWALLGLGRVDEAEEVLLFQALRDESGFLAHKLLGDLYLADGPRHNRRDAYFHYENFVKHDPGHPEAKRIRKILIQIQKGER